MADKIACLFLKKKRFLRALRDSVVQLEALWPYLFCHGANARAFQQPSQGGP